MTTGSKLNNAISDRNIWFWVYGTKVPPYTTSRNVVANDVQMLNGSHIDAVWYMPYSRFYANNNVTVHGGVAAERS